MSKRPKRTEAQRVTRLRESLGLPQNQFGAFLGVCWVTVSRWEHGHSVPSLHQRALMEAFSRSQKVLPDVGKEASQTLASSGVAAALYHLLKPGVEG